MRVLKKYLIPHEGNDHQPYLLRNEAVIGLVIVAVIAQVIFLGQQWIRPGGVLSANIANSILISQSNEQRSQAQLNNLSVNQLLERAAQAKANDMAAKGYFAHNSPDGSTPWTWISAAGYSYQYAGENLAVDFDDSTDVTNAWMNSPGHRANILNPHYTEIGMATAVGEYKGKQVTFVVEMFGRPAPAPVTTPKDSAVSQNIPSVETQSEPVTQPAPTQKIAAPRPSLIAKALPHARVVSPAAAVEKEVPTNAPAPESIAGAQTELPIAVAHAQEVNIAQKYTASPKKPLYAVYALLAGLIALALILKLTIRRHIKHPKLILNGLAVLIALGGLFWIAEYITLAHALVG